MGIKQVIGIILLSIGISCNNGNPVTGYERINMGITCEKPWEVKIDDKSFYCKDISELPLDCISTTAFAEAYEDGTLGKMEVEHWDYIKVSEKITVYARRVAKECKNEY